MTRHNPGALRVRRADGATVAVDELAALIAHLADLLDAVEGAGPNTVEGDLWALEAGVRDVVELARALGVLDGRDG